MNSGLKFPVKISIPTIDIRQMKQRISILFFCSRACPFNSLHGLSRRFMTGFFHFYLHRICSSLLCSRSKLTCVEFSSFPSISIICFCDNLNYPTLYSRPSFFSRRLIRCPSFTVLIFVSPSSQSAVTIIREFASFFPPPQEERKKTSSTRSRLSK